MNVSVVDGQQNVGILRSLFSNEQLILLGIVLTIWAAYIAKTANKAKGGANARSSHLDPDMEKASKSRAKPASALAERPLGQWVPDYSFKTPVPPAYPNWNLEKTRPLPYRAFKHKYNVTMGIRNMDLESWIELDNEWMFFHNLKLKRLAEKKDKGQELYGTSDKAIDASWELLFELCNYLPARYPSLFQYNTTTKLLKILATGETFDLTDRVNVNPIVTAAKLVQDDLAIMVENEEGNYTLESGCIVLAGFWRLSDKFQMSLDEIHLSGDVPQYSTKLGPGMRKFFRRLTVDQPVVRNNYFIQTDNNLDWSTSIGPESQKNVGWYTAPEATDVSKLFFRSERQSLRRLPISGAVVFTIRTYFMPVTKLCQEPYIPRRLLNGIGSWSEDVNEYKGFHKFKDALLPYLEKMAQEQEAKGLVLEEEPQAYPF
ncbi:hypothetical protein PVL30_001650 [Lodderomyces elongisporus]|uniref:uncharacterized protein n=1 Tax=Lodderomyces elongisporus TaxID=36914 RepID=UPI00291C5922|nr:uncharacterized protein PVL30_001650 [Lodderomyces elongisporus]WLF77927.1 hypothetical protein PVL30_001650 [Lodderomyces elongisporus]